MNLWWSGKHANHGGNVQVITDEQETHNKADNGKRAIGERGKSLLKPTFTALHNISLCPWKIGTVVKAALVILHIGHYRTT